MTFLSVFFLKKKRAMLRSQHGPLISPLYRDGTARRGAADRNGVALDVARRKKERAYLELSGDGGRARLVVLAPEVGGTMANETAQFRNALAEAEGHLASSLESHAGL